MRSSNNGSPGGRWQVLSARRNGRLGRWTSFLRRRPRGYRNFILGMISERCRLGRSLGNPVSITLEPTNACNLQCPICETGSGTLGRKTQMMSYEDFVTIMKKVGPGANHMMFYFMGEPFLNRDAYRMIRYARDMGLYVTTCTNGGPVNPQALYESGINHISFQIGGLTQKSHQVYRRNSDLSSVFDNLKLYLDIIRRHGKSPQEHEVELGFIVMRQNEREVADFLETCKKLGVKSTLISPCVRTPEQGREFLPEGEAFWLYEKDALEKNGELVVKRSLPRNRCPWLYYAMTIQVDGNVVPCCRDSRGEYVMGNLLTQPLEKVWNSPEFTRWRYSFGRMKSPPSLCRLCPGEGSPELR